MNTGLVLLALSLASGASDKDEASRITLIGKPVTREERDAEPVSLIGKKGVLAGLTGKSEELCAAGTTSVRFHAPDSYESPTRVVTLAQLLEDIEKHADGVACLLVEGDRPSRSDIDAMSKRLVDTLGISVFLPEGAVAH